MTIQLSEGKFMQSITWYQRILPALAHSKLSLLSNMFVSAERENYCAHSAAV